MTKVVALMVADFRSAMTYRLQMGMSVLGLLVSIVPLYFVANALEPMMAGAIANEGGQYFGFVAIGTATYLLVTFAVGALPQALGGSIRTGTLEALLSTPTRLPTIVAGLVSYQLLWTVARTALLIFAAGLLGARLQWSHGLGALTIMGLILIAHVPFGVLGGALILAFRTAGPLPRVFLLISGLLGGVYYPTHVVPSWLQEITSFVPLTYGLRALRLVLMDGAPFAAIVRDLQLLMLLGAAAALLAIIAFRLALDGARRRGTLTQY